MELLSEATILLQLQHQEEEGSRLEGNLSTGRVELV